MSTSNPTFLVTGASGRLGALVVEELLQTVAADNIVATARNSSALNLLEERGVTVRTADYDAPETLAAAFVGVDKLLLISSSEVGQRVAQHRNVIDAAKKSGVALIAYTSLLHAKTSTLELAAEHRETERLLADSGVPFLLLRNGWYTENYTASLAPALARGIILGSAGKGRISSATRADYAAAAVAALTANSDQAGKVYELAGDTAYTLDELAAELANQSGKPVAYRNLSQDDYRAALATAGFPEGFAHVLAQCDFAASEGALFDDNCALSRLIGRPTTSFKTTVAQALSA